MASNAKRAHSVVRAELTLSLFCLLDAAPLANAELLESYLHHWRVDLVPGLREHDATSLWGTSLAKRTQPIKSPLAHQKHTRCLQSVFSAAASRLTADSMVRGASESLARTPPSARESWQWLTHPQPICRQVSSSNQGSFDPVDTPSSDNPFGNPMRARRLRQTQDTARRPMSGIRRRNRQQTSTNH